MSLKEGEVFEIYSERIGQSYSLDDQNHCVCKSVELVENRPESVFERNSQPVQPHFQPRTFIGTLINGRS
jgi:hypothetical protein